MEIRVAPTQYVVSALPEDRGQYQMSHGTHFDLTVTYRGFGKWAVIHFGECLGTDGEWSHESSPSNREDDWIETHRFDLETALELAKAHAPYVRVNRFIAHEVAAEIEAANS